MSFWTRKRSFSRTGSERSTGRQTSGRESDRGLGSTTHEFEPTPFDPSEGLPPQVRDATDERSEPLYVAPEEPQRDVPGKFSKIHVANEIMDGELVPVVRADQNNAHRVNETISEGPSGTETANSSNTPAEAYGAVSSKSKNLKDRLSANQKTRANKKSKDSEKYAQDWHKGSKGRPTQVFIGFLPDVSKKDAVSFAIGVANKHCNNIVNTAYAVYNHSAGWAYEVHEGGPRRGYLPKILKVFEEQAGGPIREEDAVVIDTAQRKIMVERTQLGLTAFLMPESFQRPQTSWLEPGGKLKPVVPLRVWFIALGGLIFLSGFVTLITALATRPTPAPLNAPARVALPYSQLPISQWQPLVATYERGSVISALRWEHGQWLIQTKRAHSQAVKTDTLPQREKTNGNKAQLRK